MFSGFFCSATCASYTWRSRATVSAGRSSTRTASGLVAAMCTARSRASALNSSVRATKSVSQLSSTSTPILPSWCTYCPTRPPDASAPAAYRPSPHPSCGARPRPSPGRPPFPPGPSCSPSYRRRCGRAAPPRAWPESLSPSPRLLLLMKKPPSRRWARRAPVGCPPERMRPACSAFAFASAARFRRRGGGGRRFVRLEPCGDRFRLGAALAPRRILFLVALCLRLDAGLGRVRDSFAYFGRLAQRHPLPRRRHHVGDGRRDERNRPDRVIVAGDRDGDQLRVGVRVHDRDHRNAELVRLGDGDALLLRVHHEQRARQPAHVLDAREVLLELESLAVEQELLLLGVVLELPFGGALLQLLEPFDLFLDGLDVV